MFTGIIQAVGCIEVIQAKDQDSSLQIKADGLNLSDCRIGDSIAVNGVCLTATKLENNHFWVDVSTETLATTSLRTIQRSSLVNLEKALCLSTPLGGHLVSGHVDGLGEILSIIKSGRSLVYQIQVPKELAKYIAAKGSVCVDGVSLTVNVVDGNEFSITIIPHTQQQTIIHAYKVGTKVNIEIDLIARYLERLMLGDAAASKAESISEAFLVKHGIIQK